MTWYMISWYLHPPWWVRVLAFIQSLYSWVVLFPIVNLRNLLIRRGWWCRLFDHRIARAGFGFGNFMNDLECGDCGKRFWWGDIESLRARLEKR